MAFLSGFAGSMTVAASPNDGAVAFTTNLEEWIVFQDSEIIEARAKGNPWKTKFLGSSEWRAEIRSLVDDALAGAAAALIVNQAVVDVEFIMEAGAGTNLSLVGANALLSNVTTESPVDGPVIIRGTITGTGALAQTGPAA